MVLVRLELPPAARSLVMLLHYDGFEPIELGRLYVRSESGGCIPEAEVDDVMISKQLARIVKGRFLQYALEAPDSHVFS